MPKHHNTTVAKTFEAIPERFVQDVVTLNDLKDVLHDRSFCLLLLFLAMPIALPVPFPPGFTTIMGAPILVFSYQMMMGWDTPWLPKWIGKKTLKRETLARFIERSVPYLRSYERLSRPRLNFFTHEPADRFVGLLAFLCAISIVLPIPFGNTVPSIGIAVMMLGLLTRDGIIVLVGKIIALIGLVISISVVVGSWHYYPKVLDMLGIA